ncbi:MAG: hypothetical protein IJY70_00245 [Clostridia bacterium]|nr:hypothetical protein [Clostridia bacterium]
MKIKYWGTAAAEGVPAIFCSCDICKYARKAGGRNVRTRSQLCVDDKFLIDFGADTYMHSLKYGFDMSKLHTVLITHTHGDHYYPIELLNRRVGFAHGEEIDTPLTIYGSSGIEEDFYSTINEPARYLIDQNRVNFKFLSAGERYEIEGYEVFVLPAHHGTYNPLVYIIRKNGKAFAYFNDTGYPRPQFFEMLEKFKKEYDLHIDLVSYDCTGGKSDWGYDGSHMGIKYNIELREKLLAMGVTDEKTAHILHHFTHNQAGGNYDEFSVYAKQFGFDTAYDGMEAEV